MGTEPREPWGALGSLRKPWGVLLWGLLQDDAWAQGVCDVCSFRLSGKPFEDLLLEAVSGPDTKN